MLPTHLILAILSANVLFIGYFLSINPQGYEWSWVDYAIGFLLAANVHGMYLEWRRLRDITLLKGESQ